MPEQKTTSFELERGATLGKYEILRKLAAGGMAEIYLARVRGTANFEKIVVLKRILPHIASEPEFVQMFLDEARLAATLQHPNIADVYDVGEVNGTVFFTMEYVHGQDVRAIRIEAKRRDETVPIGIALAIVHGIASALDYAHEREGADGMLLGVVHRDVSSSNVMVSFDGAVKLVDFGIADAILQQHKTQTGMLKGKTAYMSPEQCRGKPLDRRSDLFSLGVVMFELTVGRRPFRGETDFAIMEQIVHGHAPVPSTIVPNYPAELEAIVTRLLARERDDRYDTAEDVLHDLEPYLAHEKLWTSPKQVGRFMRALFAERVTAWEKASHEGLSLGEHVADALTPSYPSVGTMPPASPTDPDARPLRAESMSGVDLGAETVAVSEADVLAAVGGPDAFAAETVVVGTDLLDTPRPRRPDSVPGVPQHMPMIATEPVPSLATAPAPSVGEGSKAVKVPPVAQPRTTTSPRVAQPRTTTSPRVASSLLSGRSQRPSQPPTVVSRPTRPSVPGLPAEPPGSRPLPSILTSPRPVPAASSPPPVPTAAPESPPRPGSSPPSRPGSSPPSRPGSSPPSRPPLGSSGPSPFSRPTPPTRPPPVSPTASAPPPLPSWQSPPVRQTPPTSPPPRPTPPSTSPPSTSRPSTSPPPRPPSSPTSPPPPRRPLSPTSPPPRPSPSPPSRVTPSPTSPPPPRSTPSPIAPSLKFRPSPFPAETLPERPSPASERSSLPGLPPLDLGGGPEPRRTPLVERERDPTPPPARRVPLGPPVYPVLKQASRWPLAVLVSLILLAAAGVGGYFVWQDLQDTRDEAAVAPDASRSDEPVIAPIIEPPSQPQSQPQPQPQAKPQPPPSEPPDAAVPGASDPVPPDAEPAKKAKRKHSRKHDETEPPY